MVKCLEDLAEEEQKVLLEEEKAAAAAALKAEMEKEEIKKDTIGQSSDVETPRSESGVNPPKEGETEEEKKESEEAKEKETDSRNTKEAYGLDSIKFGNAQIKGKNMTASPMLAKPEFAHLNTIEEEKNETQTSNYNMSERDESKLLSSNHLGGSTGLDFENDGHKTSMPKLSPDPLD